MTTFNHLIFHGLEIVKNLGYSFQTEIQLDAISQATPQQVALPPATHRPTAPDAVPCAVPRAGGSMRCRPPCRQRPPVTCHGGREESFGFHGNHPLVVAFFVSFTVSPTKIDSNDKHMVCHSRVVGYMLVIFCACCIRSKAERNSCLKSPQVASSSCQMLTQWLPTCASRPGSHAQKICPPMQVQDSYQ